MCRKTQAVRRQEAGFLMPVALFIVVGLGALALAINRLSSNSHSSSIQEGLAVQALYAAESGAQYGMNQLLFNASASADVDTRCTVVQGQTVAFSVTGLSHCSALLSCQKTTTTPGKQIYEITSLGRCGDGDFAAERTLVAAAAYQ